MSKTFYIIQWGDVFFLCNFLDLLIYSTYYKVAALGKKIQRNLRTTADMTPAERSDVLFYLLYTVVARVLNKKEITFSDLKNFDLLIVTDEIINKSKSDIYEKYKELGGNGRVAKSTTFINEIDKILGFQN